jgi:hypothetical protein
MAWRRFLNKAAGDVQEALASGFLIKPSFSAAIVCPTPRFHANKKVACHALLPGIV